MLKNNHSQLNLIEIFKITRIFLILYILDCAICPNPNQRFDYDILPGMKEWDGIPYHDFLIGWFAALTADKEVAFIRSQIASAWVKSILLFRKAR